MMRFRQQLWKSAPALLCAAVSAGAQTSQELQGRYGPPLKSESTRRPALETAYGLTLSETFVVRPDVSLAVTYTADGEACRAEIKPYSSSPELFPPPETVSSAEVSEIIAHLTPAGTPPEGGAAGPSTITFTGSCSAVSVERSPRLEVSRAVRAAKCGGGVYSAAVVWHGAGRRCAAPRGPRPAAPKQTSCWSWSSENVERRWL